MEIKVKNDQYLHTCISIVYYDSKKEVSQKIHFSDHLTSLPMLFLLIGKVSDSQKGLTCRANIKLL